MPGVPSCEFELGRCGASAARTVRTVEISLTTDRPPIVPSPSADALALGCWLIASWHEAPAVDHLLCSAVAGAGFAGAQKSLAAVSISA